MLTSDNYEVNNKYGVKIFYESQKNIVRTISYEEVIENIKSYLQRGEEARNIYLKSDNYQQLHSINGGRSSEVDRKR